MKYDNWKQMTPEEGELERECNFCGRPCDEVYCSSQCKQAELED